MRIIQKDAKETMVKEAQMKGWLIVGCILLLFFVSASGQRTSTRTNRAKRVAGPSLKETLKWLESNVQAQIEHTDQAGETTTYLVGKMMNLGACKVRWWITEEITRGGSSVRPSSSWRYTVSLSSLDPEQVTILDNYPGFSAVSLSTTNNDTAFRIGDSSSSTTNKDVTPETETNTVQIYTRSENAKRLANAFQNAIRLCGGKKEPF